MALFRICRSPTPLDQLLGMELLSQCISRIAARIPTPREDNFIVVEEADGGRCTNTGRYTLAILCKKGLSTPGAVKILASMLGVPPSTIGVAGLKDAQATTCQYVSLPAEKLEPGTFIQGRRVYAAGLCYTNTPLRPGEARGNRFTITIEGDAARAPEAVKRLAGKPLLAYYSYQRFGTHRPNTHIAGLLESAMLYGELIREIIDSPYPHESIANIVNRLRRHWPHNDRGPYEARVSRILGERRSIIDAAKALGSRLATFFYNALQAYFFNIYLTERALSAPLDKPVPGEKTEAANGLRRPVAPVPGRGIRLRGLVLEIYRRALAARGLDPSLVDRLPVKGYWRPLYTLPKDLTVSVVGSRVILGFALERGMYATLLLRELIEDPYAYT